MNRKMYFILFLAFLMLPIFAKEELPRIQLDTTITATVEADEAYVLFLLEEKGGSLAEAQDKLDRKQKEITEKLKVQFPQARYDALSVKSEACDLNDSTSVPTISRVFIYTISPEGYWAAELLDAGIKAGFIPFAGSGENASGAIYFGVNHSESELEKLYSSGVTKLWRNAEAIARSMTPGALRLRRISRPEPPSADYEVKFRDFKVTLPAVFCGVDRNHIRIRVMLSGKFEIEPSKK